MKAKHVAQLGLKELFSLKSDPVLILLIIYIFSVAVYTVANGVSFEVNNAAVAIVDEDRSPLSRQISAALLPPQFKEPVLIAPYEVDAALDRGDYLFVLSFPPQFERDALAGRVPELQLQVDATAIAQAGNGANYIQQIVIAETLKAIKHFSLSWGRIHRRIEKEKD